MRQVMTKICGVTRPEDAIAAIEYGADLIGLIFVEASPRYVDDASAAAVVVAVAGRAKVVGVFQNADPQLVENKRRALGLDLVQLHGSESRSTVEAAQPCIKAIFDDGTGNATDAENYAGICTYLLFDAPKTAAASGGQRTVPGCLERASRASTPFFMAGGINPENVAAIASALISNPAFAGIDVASGVESSPGIKDHEKMRALIQTVQEVSRHAIAR